MVKFIKFIFYIVGIFLYLYPVVSDFIFQTTLNKGTIFHWLFYWILGMISIRFSQSIEPKDK